MGIEAVHKKDLILDSEFSILDTRFMVVKSIVKLIDEAIIPAMVLIIVKLLGVFFFNLILKTDYEVVQKSFLNLLPSVTYTSSTDYIRIENYSNLLMFVSAASGTMIVVLKAHFLHESHISPKLHQKLETMNLANLVSKSFHIYHQAVIWLIFLWLTTLFLLLSTLSKITYIQITAIAVIIAANLTWIFAADVQKEIEISGEKS